MTLPNFIIIGAQKAGTTWLQDELGQHPDIYMPRGEIHYFDKDFNFKKGIDWYKSHFSAAKNEKAIGEKTPEYLWANGNGVEGHMPDVHRNLYKTLPDIQLIVLVRNPVERAVSSVNHILRSGRISPVHKIDDLLVGRKCHLVRGHGVIEKGLYYRQIKAFLEHFDRSQMLILFYEECVIQDPTGGLREVCDFLGVDSSFEFSNKARKRNAARRSRLCLAIDYYFPILKSFTCRLDRYFKPANMWPQKSTIKELYSLYQAENERLFQLLGREPSSWKMNGER